MNMFPHTVTVYNHIGESIETGLPESKITILRGVLLEISQGANIMKSGLDNADKAKLHIPFAVVAVDGETGLPQKYISPKEYDRLEDKTGFWTIGSRDNFSGQECFFVKGEVVNKMADYATINDLYDYAYRVSTVDIYDYGSPNMQHFEAGGQ